MVYGKALWLLLVWRFANKKSGMTGKRSGPADSNRRGDMASGYPTLAIPAGIPLFFLILGIALGDELRAFCHFRKKDKPYFR